MARAGYCTGCGGNVYLNEATGGCVNGHGPECISGVYEVGPQQPPAQVPPPIQFQPSAPVPPSAQVAPPPKKKRTGLIVAVVIIILLLLLCGCGVGGLLLFNSGSRSTSTSTDVTPVKPDPDKAKVTAAWTFYKAMGEANVSDLKSVMPAETVAGADMSFWLALVEGNKSVFEQEVWKGTTLTDSYTATDGRKGTIELKPGTGDAVLFTQQFTGAAKNEGQIILIEESDGWKVLELKSASTDLKFDMKSLKALETP